MSPPSSLESDLRPVDAVPHLQRAERIKAVLAKEISKGLPVVVGPWTGEVGFELLYWVPFVRWVVDTYHISPERLVIASRGGTASWYGDIADRYADVFSVASADTVRAANAGIKMKQSANYDALTQELLRRIAESLDLTAVSQLHPHLMYKLMRPYWDGLAPAAYVRTFASYATIRAPSETLPHSLPSDYVAVRFYSNRFFPDTPANRAFVQDTIETLSRYIPVVLLSQPSAVDDHHDIPGRSPRVVTVDDAMTVSTNLAVQTSVIGRARAFVSTYGGLCYLAPFCGVRGFGVYSDAGWKHSHLDVAHQVFRQLNGPPLTVLNPGTSATHLAEQVLGSLVARAGT